MEGTTSRLRSFVNEMREFPCSFNVGNANFDFTNHAFDSRELKEPHLQKNIWSNIKKYLEEDVDELDPDLVDPTWKDNLRVRVYAELGDFDKAEELNKEILERNPENLVALANSGFLFAFKFQFGKTKTIIEKLKERKNSQEFDRVKYEAICEQGYTYYKFSECNKTNIQSAILIMEHCVTNIPNFEKRFDDIDEKLKLMLACLYRRYVNPAINVDVKQWIIKAEKLFNSIKESTSSNSVKSICYVELARLNKNGIENGIPVSNESVIELCQLAGELNPKSKRVLIVAGPMLMTIISTGNNTEAHNYLGGVYFTQAKENKKILRAQHFLNGTAVSNDLMKPLVNFIQKIC